MTRRILGELLDFEPEIEARARRTHGQTFREKRKKQREQVDSEETISTANEESTDSSHNVTGVNPIPITEPVHAPMADQTIRFFPVAKASEIRRSILWIKQKHKESLYEYWERYKKLCARYPQHGLTEQTLVQYFYEGLLPIEMKMIDAASG
ncbi:hypothetical protein V6N12_010466 [Hibiscus sabdariffa]|uniref:Retrotransposon gag domain-containing protein n=1 Tax=Hibiscus sabdariffa TaxID=183260 RepID=A0ABR2ELN1_9ROSI